MVNENNRKLKLTIELVPETSWYNNMRKAMSKSNWDKLRKEIYKKYNNVCGICHASGRMSCHEIWKYDDEKHIQKLEGFISLCDSCHFVKHFGLAGILSMQGKLDLNKIIEHFMKVNGCDEEAFLKHKKESNKIWKERSKHNWEVDFGEYKELIKQETK